MAIPPAARASRPGQVIKPDVDHHGDVQQRQHRHKAKVKRRVRSRINTSQQIRQRRDQRGNINRSQHRSHDQNEKHEKQIQRSRSWKIKSQNDQVDPGHRQKHDPDPLMIRTAFIEDQRDNARQDRSNESRVQNDDLGIGNQDDWFGGIFLSRRRRGQRCSHSQDLLKHWSWTRLESDKPLSRRCGNLTSKVLRIQSAIVSHRTLTRDIRIKTDCPVPPMRSDFHRY